MALVCVVGVALCLYDVLALHRSQEPVEGFAGVVSPEVKNALVGTVAALLHDLAHGGVAVYLDAQVLLDLAADGAELVGTALPGLGFLDDDDVLGTVLDGRAAGAQTRKGRTDDNDVGIDGLLDVCRIDGIGRGHEAGRISLLLGGLLCLGGGAAAGHGGDAGRCGGGGDERTT